MATVILVHGIAQQQKSADCLEAQWLPALAGGLRTAGFPELADRLWCARATPEGIDARMAFYGHLFLQPDQMGDEPGELSPAQQEVAEELALAWLAHGVNRSSRPRDRMDAARELAYVRHEIGREEAGLGEVARKAVNSLARVRWFAPYGMAFAERFVWQALTQVTAYLTDDAVREAALQTVLDLAGPDTKVIIGHSLGSVVAYEAAHRLEPPLPLLVTLGSPLGLDSIIYPRLRPQPPTFPARVRRWVNVADPDDLVAAEPDLRGLFSSGLPAGAVFDGSYTVDNGAEPHSAKFYLSRAEVGRPVTRALSPGD